jgi:hypothetical protein
MNFAAFSLLLYRCRINAVIRGAAVFRFREPRSAGDSEHLPNLS